MSSLYLAHPGYIAAKAAVAAALALFTVSQLGVRDRLSATFVAVVCISPTVYTGVRRGLEQLLASVLGGTVAWLAALASAKADLGHAATVMTTSVAVFLAVLLPFRLGLRRGYLVSAFTAVYVLLIPGPAPGAVLEHRLLSVAIGVAFATLLNLSVSAVAARRVFLRRLGIARRAVAGAFRQLADAVESPPRPDQVPTFDAVFSLLRELSDELGAPAPARPGSALSAAQSAADGLRNVTHLARSVALRACARPAAAAVAAWARAFAASVERAEAGPLLGVQFIDPATQADLERALAEWERARQAERRLHPRSSAPATTPH